MEIIKHETTVKILSNCVCVLKTNTRMLDILRLRFRRLRQQLGIDDERESRTIITRPSGWSRTKCCCLSVTYVSRRRFYLFSTFPHASDFRTLLGSSEAADITNRCISLSFGWEFSFEICNFRRKQFSKPCFLSKRNKSFPPAHIFHFYRLEDLFLFPLASALFMFFYAIIEGILLHADCWQCVIMLRILN